MTTTTESAAGGAAVDADLLDAAARLRLVVARLARAVRHHGSAGLTPSQLSALATLEEAGPIRLGDLAARESVGAPVVSRVVDSLQQLGFVSREVDEADRRACRIALTDAGQRTLESLWRERTAGLTGRIDRLDARQRAALLKALPVLEVLARESV